MERGRFIVIYGINNLGKTTQAKLLVERLKSLGRKAEYLKYPVYDLGPSGPDLDEYLRHANPKRLDAEQAQTLFAENRTQFEPTLKSKLANGIDIVAEDYWGTGLAWGIGAGADKGFLLKINRNFLREDLALLLVGKRFDSGKEIFPSRNRKIPPTIIIAKSIVMPVKIFQFILIILFYYKITLFC